MSEPVNKEKNRGTPFENEIIQHLEVMHDIALSFTADPYDAEDLVQETMIKAFRNFNSFENGSNGKAWLYRILKNSYINAYRKESKRPSKIEFDEEWLPFEKVHPKLQPMSIDHLEFENNSFLDFIEDDIYRALSDLEENFRMVFLLHAISGFTYEEISNMLDIPIGTVRSRLHRGRQILKNRLSEYGRKRGYLKRHRN